ncbi:protein of unknown function [Haloarcula vallismortis]|uniref:DUF4352 domain-containing protein n=2 Tax=Haloarcula vallismortis TaxID=28442 RepID=M0JK82_HALVA|nr:DUF4352 domain-containing protein [Haloarcula vallismortis]EMA08090.1 hypothetical protein C437_08636 [Haloarcula vallismortis ATCC 29715]SDX30862.1 protein of unknown function [Haloarcula vallismortis]
MDRRTYVRTLGSSIAALSLAGCNGSDGEDGSSESTTTPEPTYEVDQEAPARLKLLSVSGPKEVAFGDTIEGDITAVNVGGEPISGDATIEFVHSESADTEPQTVTVNADGLASGEEVSHSYRVDAEYAGTWAFEVSSDFYAVDDTVTSTVSVLPKQGSTGDTIELASGVQATVSDMSYEQMIAYELSPGERTLGDNTAHAIRETVSDNILLMLSVTFENGTGEAQTVSKDDFILPEGSFVSKSAAGRDGKNAAGENINPGQTYSGHLIYAVPKAKVDDLTFGINLAKGSAVADIELPLQSPSGFPEFELANIDVPPEDVTGDEAIVEMEVENVGDSAGMFQSIFEFKTPEEPSIFASYSADTWYIDADGPFTQRIPAGETRTIELVTEPDPDRRWDYRTTPFGAEWTFKAVE